MLTLIEKEELKIDKIPTKKTFCFLFKEIIIPCSRASK